MWFIGTKTGIGVWFILWKNEVSGNFNSELYKTPYGVRNWLTNSAYSNLNVVRVGRAVLTPNGWEEKDVWNTRAEFLNS